VSAAPAAKKVKKRKKRDGQTAGVAENSRELQSRHPVSDVEHLAIPPRKAKRKKKRSKEAAGLVQTWPGWKQVIDEELRAAGGAMPWKRLRSVLVERRLAASNGATGLAEALGVEALASVPMTYLSQVDDLVRLP